MFNRLEFQNYPTYGFKIGDLGLVVVVSQPDMLLNERCLCLQLYGPGQVRDTRPTVPLDWSFDQKSRRFQI